MPALDLLLGWAGGVVLGIGGGLAATWAAWLALDRFAPDVRLHLRIAALAIAVQILLAAVFGLLVAFASFARIPAFGLLGVLALAAHRTWAPGERSRRDARFAELRAAVAELREGPAGRLVPWAALLVGLVAALKLARAAVAPPLATDALTYHLVRASRWAKDGAWVTEHAPDAWRSYEWYQPLGDALWAWALLPVQGPELLVLGSALALVAVVVGAYALARSIDAPRPAAALAALALVATPSAMAFVTACYVDLFVLGATACALAWLAAALRSPTPVAAAIAGAGLGLAAGIKPTGLAPLGVAAIALLVVALRRGSEARRRVLLAFFAAACVGAAGYLRAVLVHGNPLHPFPLTIFGLELGAGDEEMVALHSAELAPPELARFDLGELLRTLFVPRALQGIQHLNLGPAVPLVLAAAVAGAVRLWRRADTRLFACVLAGLVAIFVVHMGSPGMRAHRTFAAPAVGRFLTVPLLATCVLAAVAVPARLRWLWAIPIGVGVLLSFPRGLGEVDRDAFVALAPCAVIVLALAIATVRVRARATSVLAFALAAIALALALVWPGALRPRFRDRYWAAAVPAASFDPHPLDERAVSAWPIWSHLADREPLVVAFAAGWDGRGHNWYRAPLFGSRLQHDVVWIAPTQGGEPIDYRRIDLLGPRLDPRAWIRALVDREVDVLVFGWPPPPEADWARGPAFAPIAVGAQGRAIAYAIDREALAAMLGAPQP